MVMRGRAERLARRPEGWPLRWRLAAVSAGLTMAILVVFAVIIGRLAQDRIQDDFSEELREVLPESYCAIGLAHALRAPAQRRPRRWRRLRATARRVEGVLGGSSHANLRARSSSRLGAASQQSRQILRLLLRVIPVAVV